MDNQTEQAKRKLPAKPHRKHFTETNVLKLPPKKGRQYLVWDQGTGAARGLAILVSPTGTASYRTVFYFKGSPKPHWMHLGRVGEMKLADARDLCRKARARAKEGEDPNEKTHGDSFEVALTGYISDYQVGERRNKSAELTKAHMLRTCAAWRPRSVATIRDREIKELLRLIRDGDGKELRPKPYLANRLHSHLRSFFQWCVGEKMIKVSPMLGMAKPFARVQPRNRPWFKGEAADNAIKSLWHAADQIGGNEGRYVKAILLLGKRKVALANMLWEEIDKDWFWNAPQSDSNKKLFGVPLSKLAQRVIGPRQQAGKVFGDIDLSRLQAKVRKLSGIEDFIWHGVRHVLETRTADIGILPHVRDLLFDHLPERGSGRGYDHADYKNQMRAAVEAWADHVEALVTPPGVTRLHG